MIAAKLAETSEAAVKPRENSMAGYVLGLTPEAAARSETSGHTSGI
jgi:hypothetical protein